MNQKKIIKFLSGISVAIIILNFIIQLSLGEQIVAGNENLRLFFSFFPTAIVLGTLSIAIIIDAVFKCRRYEQEPQTETALDKMSKKTYYTISTCVLISFIFAYCIVSFFVTKENALFQGGSLRIVYLLLFAAVAAVAVARNTILKKVYSDTDIKKQTD